MVHPGRDEEQDSFREGESKNIGPLRWSSLRGSRSTATTGASPFKKSIRCRPKALLCLLLSCFIVMAAQNIFAQNKSLRATFLFPDDAAAAAARAHDYDTDWWVLPDGAVPSPERWWRGRSLLPHAAHPHLGARHPNGTLGMILDPSPARLRPSDRAAVPVAPHVLCPAGDGIETPGGHRVLRKVRRGMRASRRFLRRQREAASGNGTLPGARGTPSKILCLVYAVHLPPTYRNPSLAAQADTWGRRCDGFLAASNLTDHATGAVDLPHAGPEAYGNMWQKIRTLWTYAYDHYRGEYDFFYIGGDDVYVVVDNLRAYVDGPQVRELERGGRDVINDKHHQAWPQERGPRPLLLAVPVAHKGRVFPCGGPGYVLNRVALALLVEEGIPSFPAADAADPREDVFVGGIFCNYIGMCATDTKDARHGDRFGHSAKFQAGFDGTRSWIMPKQLTQQYGLTFPPGIDSVSEQYIAMHLKKEKPELLLNWTIPELIYRYHAVLHDWCEATDADGGARR